MNLFHLADDCGPKKRAVINWLELEGKTVDIFEFTSVNNFFEKSESLFFSVNPGSGRRLKSQG